MLDLVLLRTFVSVVDTGNFTRAGEHLHLTQSTVSQQVIRLEQNLGCRLLDRSQRQVLPTEEGERLLGYARRLLRLSDEASEALSPAHGDGVLRLGVPEDLAGEVLMPVLTRFTEERPRLRLEVESGLSHHLLRLYRSGELDLLLVKQWGADSDCHARWAEPLGWFGSAARPFGEGSPEEPVPLVVFPVGALYRQEMIHALESIGRRWRIGYSSASLASLVAAVGAGLGVSLLPLGCVGPEHRLLGAQAGFPPIAGLNRASRGHCIAVERGSGEVAGEGAEAGHDRFSWGRVGVCPWRACLPSGRTGRSKKPAWCISSAVMDQATPSSLATVRRCYHMTCFFLRNSHGQAWTPLRLRS
ncbi:LysR family transcriptional regulator [Pseudomonas aeruginosa]|nr:LysR family transcriptional regulator [Pseudomonas aeruginosa]